VILGVATWVVWVIAVLPLFVDERHSSNRLILN
jgi:hypothetical protein